MKLILFEQLDPSKSQIWNLICSENYAGWQGFTDRTRVGTKGKIFGLSSPITEQKASEPFAHHAFLSHCDIDAVIEYLQSRQIKYNVRSTKISLFVQSTVFKRAALIVFESDCRTVDAAADKFPIEVT